MIEQLRKTYKNMILVDAGDMFFKTKTLPELRAKLILNGMNRMGYDAVTFGEGELNMDFGFLMEELKKTSMTYVSSNIQILDAQNNKILLPYIIKEINGLKIAVTATTPGTMMDDNVHENKQITIEHPISSLKKTIAQLKEKSDFIILLSHFGMGGTKNLFMYNNLSDISLAIVGHGRFLTDKAVEESNGTLLVQNSLGGEYLALLKFKLDDKGKVIDYKLETIPLTADVPEDKYLLAEMKKFRSMKNKEEMTEAAQKANEKKQKEGDEILQLSPEAFIKRMKTKEGVISE